MNNIISIERIVLCTGEIEKGRVKENNYLNCQIKYK